MGRIVAICVSEKKGTVKHEVPVAKFIEDHGIEGDAHAGKWHRQVSLLSHDRVEEFRRRGAEVANGAFGENLLVEGFDFKALPVGTRFHAGDVVLEMTQIGKECHSGCEIYKKMGDCIMPREGVFARVIHGGEIRPGDELEIMQLTHFDDDGNARMVDVSDKDITERVAIASGSIWVNQAVFDAIEAGKIAKGDVLAVATTAGIMGAKRTAELIPMCHVLPLSHLSIVFDMKGARNLTDARLEIACQCTAKVVGRTGVEMEALTGVSVALLTVYDMCKALDKGMEITDVRLVKKSGGKSGDFEAAM